MKQTNETKNKARRTGTGSCVSPPAMPLKSTACSECGFFIGVEPMRISKQWGDHPEIFALVADTLEDAADEYGVRIIARDEEDGYGEQGYIIIETDGKRFSLSLNAESF